MKTFFVDLPAEEQMLDTTPGIIGGDATHIIGTQKQEADPIAKSLKHYDPVVPISPVEALPKALRKKADRWSERFGAIPVEEIRQVALEHYGVALDASFPPELAEATVARWMVENEFRMTRELKHGRRNDEPKDGA